MMNTNPPQPNADVEVQRVGFNSNIEQIQAFLTANYEFKFNSITQRLLVRIRGADNPFHYLETYEFNTILRKIKTQNIGCSKDTLFMILRSDFVPQFDPYGDYLNNLPEWDGVDYIAQLASSATVTQPVHFEKCLRKWLVAMVATLLDENVSNQTAIVFSGAQGIGKTTWFHTILPKEFQEFIHEGYVHTKDKESSVKLSECVLILMDELENLTEKNIDGVKQLMTQKGTNLRRAYTPMTQYYRSRASFAGTVNRKHFLKDLTGNRRFLCFEALNFNLQHNIPHDKLFSQAVYLFKHGFQYWFDQDEIAELDRMNTEFRDISVEEEAFVNHFEIGNLHDDNLQFLTTTQIHQQLVLKTGHKSLSIYQLGHVLRELKVPRPKRNGVYGYLVKAK
ncbi:VapE domain-containing protein [uncultured Muribaculum sp.]|uniref:VapE domain-containing protein n=1 Tax=uncultured Muribaculum sp. TaxID=1918613 RepID=UPI0025AF604E|nr:VapE domain-containing protein [uncultured Muribaculum sp.]